MVNTNTRLTSPNSGCLPCVLTVKMPDVLPSDTHVLSFDKDQVTFTAGGTTRVVVLFTCLGGRKRRVVVQNGEQRRREEGERGRRRRGVG